MSLSTVDYSPRVNGHWRQLAVLLKREPVLAAGLLRRPPPPTIPEQEILHTVKTRASHAGLGQLLEKHLLSCLLLTSGKRHKRPAQAGTRLAVPSCLAPAAQRQWRTSHRR